MINIAVFLISGSVKTFLFPKNEFLKISTITYSPDNKIFLNLCSKNFSEQIEVTHIEKAEFLPLIIHTYIADSKYNISIKKDIYKNYLTYIGGDTNS